MESYKNLTELIDINKNILEQCEINLREIEHYLRDQGAPKGYSKGTSYLDADCIRSTRAELRPDLLQKLIEEAERLNNMIYIQRGILDRLIKTKDSIDDKLKNLQGLEHKIVYLKYVEGYDLQQIASCTGFSYQYIRRIHMEIQQRSNRQAKETVVK